MTARKDGPSAGLCMRVMKRDRFRCTYCGAPGTEAELQIDHIHPVSKGGSHHIANLTTACMKCNQKKGNREMAPRAQAEPDRAKPVMIVHMFPTPDQWFIGEVADEDGDLILVQHFSAWTGEPTEIKAYPKAFIYSDSCKLFTDRYASHCFTRRRMFERFGSHDGTYWEPTREQFEGFNDG